MSEDLFGFCSVFDFFEFCVVLGSVFVAWLQLLLNFCFCILEHLFPICQYFLYTEYREILKVGLKIK